MKRTSIVIALLWAACGSDTNTPEQTGPVTGVSGSGGSAVSTGTAAASGGTKTGASSPSGTAGTAAGAMTATRTTPPGPTVSTPAPAAGGQTTTNAAAAGSGGTTAGGAAGSAGSATQVTAGAAAPVATAPTVACDPSDKTPGSTPYTGWTDKDTPPTGKYKVVIETNPGIADQTILRPEVDSETKMPIIVWGQGGCIKMGLIMVEFLYDLASHGFMIIADGPPTGGTTGMGGTGEVFKKSLDWAFAENERPCSPYYHKLDTTKVAASGQSCGGIMTYAAAGDPRLTTIAFFNSGLFQDDPAMLAAIHTPTAYFLGGSSDIAYANGERDYAALAKTAKFPVFDGNNTFGHGGTYNNDNGGECARVAEAWFGWQLLGDEGDTGKGMFWGKDCGLCKDKGWTVKSVNMGM